MHWVLGTLQAALQYIYLSRALQTSCNYIIHMIDMYVCAQCTLRAPWSLTHAFIMCRGCYDCNNTGTLYSEHSLVSKWTYLFQTIPDINSILDPLELTLRTKFIPALTGRPPSNDQECNLSPRRSWLDESSETVCHGVLCLSKDLWTLESLYYPADPWNPIWGLGGTKYILKRLP